MSFRNKGTTGPTVIVSKEPDYSGNVTCDGTADDVEIQAAIDYINTFGGGRVFLRRGTYYITTEILLEDNLDLCGEGIENTLLYEVNGVNINGILRANNKNYFSIHDMTLDGNQTNNPTAVNIINLENSDYAWLYNLELLNGKRNCLYMENCEYTYITNSYGYGANTNQAFSILEVDRSIFDNLIAKDCVGFGFDFSDVTYSTISNLYSYGTNTTIKFDMGNLVTDICSNLVVNNIIVDGVTNAVTFHGISADYTENSVFSNINTVNTEYGVRVGTNCSNLVFHGGNITDVAANGPGFYCLGTDIEISDFNIDITSTSHALEVVTGTRNMILNNKLNNSGAGDSLRMISADNIAMGNRIIAGNVTITGTDCVIPEIFVNTIDPLTTLGDHPVVTLADNATTNVYNSINLPLEFQQLITAELIVTPGGTGNMRWQLDTDFGKICANENYNAHSDSVPATDTAVDLNQMECLDISTALTGIAAGDLIGFNFARIGGHANDTVNADCYYMGIRLRYV